MKRLVVPKAGSLNKFQTRKESPIKELFRRTEEAQSVERATPGEEVPGSIPAVAARSLLVGSVSV